MFRNLYLRLLFSYLSVMVAIMVTSIAAMYQFVNYNLYKKIDQQLITLADAAAHSLLSIKADAKAVDQRISRPLNYDGDLDIPWQDLHENHQAVEWFDPQGISLGRAGESIPEMPLMPNVRTFQKNKIRMITVPVYYPKKQLQGYVRVSDSTENVEEELDRLLWGLEVGGLIAVILSGIGGKWLAQQALKPIERSFEQLKQFTADASHELRTPLAAIKISVEVMGNHPERIHPADVKKLRAIASATNQMTRLVEDLLILARSDATLKTINFDWVSLPLDELLEDLVDLLLPQAEAKGIMLRTKMLSEVIVKGNAALLKRLFSNLIENALQYTSSGGTVTVRMENLERFVVVTVEDTGIGIEPNHLPRVFDRFWRAESVRTHRASGMGLGLAIARSIAQDHKGEITASSQFGMGSCFSVRLPVA